MNEDISLAKLKGYKGDSLKGVVKQFDVVNTFVNYDKTERVSSVANLELLYTNDTKHNIKEMNDDWMDLINEK